MNLSLDMDLAVGYHSQSQKIRVATENWVKDNMYCPHCGCNGIVRAENNSRVKDFYCANCNSEYELKSKSGSFAKKIDDGAYTSMIGRITGNANPDFFLLAYDKNSYTVTDFSLVPKHFFVPDIIEKRNPLSPKARRAGWVGCNILIDKIPEQGRINIIENGAWCDRQKVIDKLNAGARLAVGDIESRGWLFDVLNVVNGIKGVKFTLSDIYAFEGLLAAKRPDNKNVRAKIRQQLQFLRDRGFIAFSGGGNYLKIL